MGTELLKEQYNYLLNDQKSKLQKLKQKKQQMVQTNPLLHLEEDNELELDEKNSDFDKDFFAKFNKLENLDSSDEDEATKSKGNKKLTFKKNNAKKIEPKQLKQEYPVDNNDLKESVSFSDKLREMKDENGRFRKLLAEKDYEISYLKKKIDEEKSIIGIGPISGDAAATKIVDLAKKLRELTATHEAEKNKTKQLIKSCKDLENQLVKLKEKSINNGKESEETEEVSDDENEPSEKRLSLNKQVKDLKDKLNQATHKMMEYRSQTEILKQDLKKTQKALEKEVGENVDIKSILSGQSNWKGRAQQNRILQNKLNEFKLQAGLMDARASQILLDEDELDEGNFLKEVPKSSNLSIMSGYTLNSGSTRTNIDSKYRYELKKIDKEKKEQIEKLKRDYEALETDNSSIKEKFEASKSRNKVLANENKTFKDQVKTLLEKGKHDDELIEALMKKQNQLKDLVETLSHQNNEITRQYEFQSKDSTIKSMQDKNTADHLKSIIAEREQRVKELEKDLESVKEMKSGEFFIHAPRNENPSSPPMDIDRNRPSSSSNNTFMRARSDSINDRENDRNISSRNSVRNLSGKPSNQRPQSVTNLNAKLIEQKKENLTSLKLENNELKTLNKTSEIERMRLMELVKTLQKRIEDLNEKSIESENKLFELRRKSVNIEKQLEKSKLQDPKNSSANNKQKQANNTQMDQYKIEELETSLLIQKDENDALKAALKSTLEAKEEDLRLYVEMLEGSKRIFLDGLKQYKQIATNEN